ncbi:MAG: hypothetical protein M0Z88_09995 [Actinomycetota bacterium]|nr:hypothetical protein [Actinomycetota bacterium]
MRAGSSPIGDTTSEDEIAREWRAAVEAFLRTARAKGADRGSIARHRRASWAVGLREPAPILATYMARRPPAFVRNLAGPPISLDDLEILASAPSLAGKAIVVSLSVSRTTGGGGPESRA